MWNDHHSLSVTFLSNCIFLKAANLVEKSWLLYFLLMFVVAGPALVIVALEWYATYSPRHCLNFSLLFVQISLQVIFRSVSVIIQLSNRLFTNLCWILLGGIQFAAAQLPNLELMDCGMTISDPDLDNPTSQENNDLQLQRTPNSKQHLIYQKLIIKHTCLKKLSLWGCSGLDVRILH